MHNFVAIIVGVIVGGMYYQVDLSIGGSSRPIAQLSFPRTNLALLTGFQSRIGSLFFLGCLLAFGALSALANFAHLRSIFLRERARSYYSPFAWVASRVVFDIVPLRLIPTLILGIIV